MFENLNIDLYGLWWIFLDIPIFCIIILIFFYWRFFQNKSALPYYMTMRFIILGMIIFSVMDCIFDLIRCKMLELPLEHFIAFYIIYNMVTALTSALWFRFSRRTLGYGRGPLTVSVWISVSLCVVYSFVTYAFKDTGEFFYEKNGSIELGPLDTIWYVIEYLPVLWSFILAQTYFINKKFILLREKCFPLLVSAYLFLFFGFMQYLLDSFPVFEMGVTLAIMYLYHSLSNTLISIDELTNLKNRRQLFKDMNEKMLDKNADWYLLIYDVDKFKDINDTYGHVEGDAALIAAASTLNEACQGRNAQAYRYGGDEFFILKDVKPDEDILDFCEDVIRSMYYKNISMNKPYTVNLSYGRVRYRDNVTTFLSDLIKLADEKMYEMKRLSHAARMRGSV